MKVYRLLAVILLVVLMTSLIGCTPKAETPAVTEVPPAATDAPVAT